MKKQAKRNPGAEIRQYFRRQRKMSKQITSELAHVFFYKGKKFLTKEEAEQYKKELDNKEKSTINF
tara:strand:+ start:152 stop:349 length:198 start_codon:yes stop_codon:yes gene_type:complete